MGDEGTAEQTTTVPQVPVHRWVMATLMVVFNLVDVVLTRAVLAAGGTEANPIMRPVMEDAAGALFVKTLVALGVGALLVAAPVHSKFADRAVATVLVLYVCVVGWNLGVLAYGVS